MSERETTTLVDFEAELLAADAIGDVIEHWGFRKVLGRVWTVLFIAGGAPAGARPSASGCSMSAGAVSMSLTELQRWGVVQRVWQAGRAQGVLRGRDRLLEDDLQGLRRARAAARRVGARAARARRRAARSAPSRRDLRQARVDRVQPPALVRHRRADGARWLHQVEARRLHPFGDLVRFPLRARAKSAEPSTLRESRDRSESGARERRSRRETFMSIATYRHPDACLPHDVVGSLERGCEEHGARRARGPPRRAALVASRDDLAEVERALAAVGHGDDTLAHAERAPPARRRTASGSGRSAWRSRRASAAASPTAARTLRRRRRARAQRDAAPRRRGRSRRRAGAAPTRRASIYGNAASIFGGDWLLVDALCRIQARGRRPTCSSACSTVIKEMVIAESLQLARRGKVRSDARRLLPHRRRARRRRSSAGRCSRARAPAASTPTVPRRARGVRRRSSASRSRSSTTCSTSRAIPARRARRCSPICARGR